MNKVLLPLMVVAVSSAISFLLGSWFLSNLGTLLILQLGVVTVALVSEKPSALFAGALSALSFNYFFTQPLYSLHMSELDDIVNLFVFLVIAVITSHLATYYRSQQEELKQTKIRSSILLSVSHDLRTPLSTIIGTLGTLQNYHTKLSEQEKSELISAALEESHRLHRYVENLLQATKIQHGEISLNTEIYDLHSLFDALQNRFGSQRLILQLPQQLIPIMASMSLLEQAFYNLIDNALTYSEGDVIISVQHNNNSANIYVIDLGPGIVQSKQEKVFDLFYSTRQGDSGEGGTGLGLAVAQGIIHAHNGRIRFVPVSRGCKIEVNLPIIAHMEKV